MLLTTFELWDEMKTYARAYALSSRPLPLDDAATMWLMNSIGKTSLTVPAPDAFAFYFGELCLMIETLRQRTPVAPAV